MAVGNSGLYRHVVPTLKKIRVGGGYLLEWKPSCVLEGIDVLGERRPRREYTSILYCRRDA